MNIIIVDMLARGKGKKRSTVDVIGAGPRTIAGILEKNKINVSIAPGEIVLEKPSILENFDVLFISGMISDIEGTRRLLGNWRKRNSRKPVISGGPIAKNAHTMIELGADVTVIGEAEETIEELIKNTSLIKEQRIIPEELEQIKGIGFKDNRKNTLIITPKRPLLSPEKLNSYLPSYKTISHYPGFWAARVYVEVVRGCSNVVVAKDYLSSKEKIKPYPGCAYCSVVSIWGPSRTLSIERIKNEIQGLIDEGVKRIVLSAPDILDYGREKLVGKKFLSDPKNPKPNISEINNLLKTLYTIPEIATGEVALMIENIKPSTVNEESAQLLGYYLEGSPVHIGLESGDNELLKKLGRPSTVEETITAIKQLSENKLRPYVYLIYGLPGQTKESIYKTIRLIPILEKIGVEKITLYKFLPLPETILEKYPPGNSNEPHNKLLIERVREYNRKAKMKLIGNTLQVVVVGKERETYYSYPIKHGPVVLIKKDFRLKKELLGRKVKVKITNVGERTIMGQVIKVGRYIRRKSLWEQ